MLLLSLPNEAIVHILALAEPPDIVRCSMTCRLFRQIIESSAELQYLIKLGSFGYVPPANPRLDLSFKEKISSLDLHQVKWGSDTHMRVDTHKLRTLEARSMTYDFHGGTYVRGSSLPGMSECTRRLDIYQLPSVNKGTEWREWSHPDLGVDVRDFALQTDYDLLVLLEADEPVSDREASEIYGTTPDALQHIKVHLRSLETGQPHPVATRSVLECQVPSYMQSMCSFYAQVVGRYLAVFFQVLAWRGTRCYELRIWDWITGRLVSYIEPYIDGAESFTFLSDRTILVPCPVTFTSGRKLIYQAHLDVYKFDEPLSEDAVAQPAYLVASFCLPELPEDQTTISRFSCRCDPAPSPSAQIAVPYAPQSRIFDLASNNRVICIAIEALNNGTNMGGRSRTKSMLYIRCTGLLNAVKDSLAEDPQGGSPTTILWKDWAGMTSWIDVGQIYTGNQCYVYGQRTVGLVYARNEDVADDAEEETTRIHSLVIFDFDPVRVKQASQRTQPGVRISRPETENAWDIPMEETKLMRNVFLGGESKANVPFSVRTTLINERFHSPYCYVMIDEEHVVIVLAITSFRMPILFLDLPKEIILHVLTQTPAQDLLKWCQVCQFLKQLVETSAELQYLIELYSFGYVPPIVQRHDILYPEKLRLVKEHQKRWKSTSWTQVDTYPLKKRNPNSTSSTYDFCGGIYAQGFSLLGIGEHTRRLDFYQLPSVNRGTPWKQWSFEDLGVDVRDFVMQPDYDLLVLLEMNQSVPYPNSDGIEGTPDLMQYFTIHLRTLGTNQPHPDAMRPTISYNTVSYRRTRSSFYFQIVGRYLAIQFLVTDASGSDKFKLRVWDWTTGKDVTYIEPWRTGAKSFTFLTDRLILVPCLQVVSQREGGLHNTRTHGKLVVFTFTEPTDNSPAEEARPVASFDLPDAANPYLDLQGLSCRCDPAPVPSSRSATRHDGIPKLFDLAPESRVLCLKLRSQATVPVEQVESTLYIQFINLINAIAHLLDQPADTPTSNIPWKDWANGTSWVDTDLLFTGNECYVYGQRVVSVGLDRSEIDSDMEEIETLIRRFSSLCVFDFDPIRIKREVMLNESEIDVFDPKNDSILGVWGEGHSLRSTFLEGEHTADALFALRKTLINERLGHHYYVMVDEEHVVMALTLSSIRTAPTPQEDEESVIFIRLRRDASGYELGCGGAGRGKELIPGGWSRGNGLTTFTTNQRLQSILNHTTMAAPVGDIGLIGLAVMGQNLILNMNDKGFTVVAYNRTTSKVDHFLQNEAKGTNIVGAYSIEELVAKLKTPRKIVMLVKAGDAVDNFIQQLVPHLEKGDIIIDGGNSYYPDSIRRTKELEEKGLLFVGSGVSGGEEGARHGPSLMPGGSQAAWEAIKPIFQKTAAQVGSDPCCDWMGPTGAGHYVKMVHNGIEYGDMQLIAEAYDILKRGLGLHESEIAEIFAKWNKGVLDSFLIDITTNILKFNDEDGEPMVTKILDKAGQKGTGKWTAINALDAGMPVTLIGEAVFARCLSAIKDERTRASKVLSGPVREEFRGDKQQFIDDLEQALYASKIISYTQGFMLMRQTAKELGWELNYAGIARIWRGGCIIKSVFLNDITKAYEKNHDLESLLFDDFFNKAIHNAQPGWRRVNAQATLWGIPTPAFSTALAFFDGYRSEVVSANILQAQRDYFGAHTFRVLPGKENARLAAGQDIHINWTGRGGTVASSTYDA